MKILAEMTFHTKVIALKINFSIFFVCSEDFSAAIRFHTTDSLIKTFVTPKISELSLICKTEIQ